MQDKEIDAENAQDLASLWLNQMSNYSLLSNIMRKYPKNWDGFKDVEVESQNTNVFFQWINRVRSALFENHDSFEKKLPILNEFKEDIKWWVENKGAPINKSNVDFKVIIPSLGSTIMHRWISQEPQRNKRIYEEWCNIWIDSGWIKDKDILNALLIKSMLIDNTSIVKKLINHCELDVNQDVTKECQEYYFDSSFRVSFHNPKHKQIKLGFFAQSENMARALSELGFNWDIEILGESLRNIMQKKDSSLYINSNERKRTVMFIDDECLQHKRNDSHKVISAIKSATNLDGVSSALRKVNLGAIKGENGENVLHILAKCAPKAFKKYAFVKSGLELLDMPDNDGRYPLDYFFCFASSGVLNSDLQKVIDASEKHKLRKPNWLEVKMLIVENHATYSGVDSAPMNMWQQQTPEEFKACLKTERGQKLIKMATNYKYNRELPPMYQTRDFYDHDVFCGMNIYRYVNSSDRKDEFSFFDMANTEDEIELSLLQLAIIIEDSIKGFEDSFDTSIKKQFDSLIEKAISNNIDITVLKEKMLAAKDPYRMGFEYHMCEHFDTWKNIEIMEERRKLLFIVNKDSLKKPNCKTLEHSAL